MPIYVQYLVYFSRPLNFSSKFFLHFDLKSEKCVLH